VACRLSFREKQRSIGSLPFPVIGQQPCGAVSYASNEIVLQVSLETGTIAPHSGRWLRRLQYGSFHNKSRSFKVMRFISILFNECIIP
jgi:hypothetical protein